MLSKQIREKVEVVKICTSITHMERLIRQTNIQIQHEESRGEVSEEDKVKLTRLSERLNYKRNRLLS